MDSTGEGKARERKEVELRGSTLKGEKSLNAVKLPTSPQARDGARKKHTISQLPDPH